MKSLIPLIMLFAFMSAATAQNAKKNPPVKGASYEPWQTQIRRPDGVSVPPAKSPLQPAGSARRQPMPPIQRSTGTPASVKITRGENGLPIAFQGKTSASGSASDTQDMGARALQYVASLQPGSMNEPLAEFTVTNVKTDAQGNTHVRMQQVFRGVPVYGGEMIAHTQNGAFDMLNGRYYPTPALENVTPALDAARAVEQVKITIGTDKVKNTWTAEELQIIGGQPFTSELVVYHAGRKLNAERLAWHIVAYPNLMSREVYFVDAATGEIIHHFDNTCNVAGHRHGKSEVESAKCEVVSAKSEGVSAEPEDGALVDGPVTATGTDLLGVSRSFGAWQSGSQIVLEDASKFMFNNSASSMPNDPVGALITVDALNTSPENQSGFNYTLITSNSTTFNNTTAVSGHWNSIKSYDYFKNTFNRNSIDGAGGNIIAFVNVSEGDGSSMENAYWNGAAMWYGNGGSIFKKLARGLDVGGHEMTHGVVEKTANLEYQDESGALNESFADVFGVMIDRDDWNIGEDVMQNGATPNNVLRSMSDPHNGGTSLSQWYWQPNHTNEQYGGNEDNGGVHINSGIPNHAFYLFANASGVGKDKAEQVYYKALDDYLVKSSQFIDARIAVIQAATDLYGSTVANAAASAFAQVGIGNAPGGNYLGQLTPNPGSDLILCVSNDDQDLDIARGSDGFVLGSIYTNGLRSRPSISDDGSQIAFVNADGDIILVDLVYSQNQIIPTVNPPYSADPIWRNVAISKDGTYLAAITEDADNIIYIADLSSVLGDTYAYELYNPTYSENTVTGEVQYADVLEFDYSGENLMYDAFNDLSNGTTDLSYWDIGFLQFKENGNFVTAPDIPFISKLFTGIPENTSVGDPTFSKNSPYVLAFDFFANDGSFYDIYGVNSETGDNDVIVSDNGDLGWPSYTTLDNGLLHQSPDIFGDYDLYVQGVAANKITGQGNASLHVISHQQGVWFANGDRSLQVGTGEANASALQLSVAPNPTSDFVRVQMKSAVNASAQMTVSNLLGETLQAQTVQLSTGANQFELSLKMLPTGTYLVRIATDKTGAVVKVVKQ
ncbi:MAG TPA: M4 family metallopeptidase [Saprospiraceae bacterium]|nr:M4 family metallopeptidase [Saprospiraceae bacterium]